MKLQDEEECQAVAYPGSSRCELAHKGFPSEVYGVEWDLIRVDAPTGWHDDAPGRNDDALGWKDEESRDSRSSRSQLQPQSP